MTYFRQRHRVSGTKFELLRLLAFGWDSNLVRADVNILLCLICLWFNYYTVNLMRTQNFNNVLLVFVISGNHKINLTYYNKEML